MPTGTNSTGSEENNGVIVRMSSGPSDASAPRLADAVLSALMGSSATHDNQARPTAFTQVRMSNGQADAEPPVYANNRRAPQSLVASSVLSKVDTVRNLAVHLGGLHCNR